MELAKLEHFFQVDMMIKKEMNNIYPKGYFSDDAIIDYIDDTYESIEYIFSEFKCLAIDIFGIDSPVYRMVLEKEEKIKNIIPRIKTVTDARIFYEKFVSEMKPDFITSVSKNFVGYFLSNSVMEPTSKASTINEILHLMHSYVTNNDKLLKSIPLIAEDTNAYESKISLRGHRNKNFASLFIDFPKDIFVGDTEMISISDNKMIMMIRDLGHALTIEITLSKDKARLEYFIPKLCNEEMIKKLPGLSNINNISRTAIGVIEVPIDEYENALFDFIKKVPTDMDMPNIPFEESMVNPIKL